MKMPFPIEILQESAEYAASPLKVSLPLRRYSYVCTYFNTNKFEGKCRFCPFIYEGASYSGMGVQGAKPLAGGSGVSPESLPFSTPGRWIFLIPFTLIRLYRSRYYASYYTYNICKYYHYCRGHTYHTYRIIANCICGPTFTRNPQCTIQIQACSKSLSSPEQISSTGHRWPLPYSR